MKGYTFDLVPRAFDKISIKMKELEQYLGTTYSDSCQPAIMTETVATFPNLEMPTITDLVIELPKNIRRDGLSKKKNIGEAICKNQRKKDVYQSDMHKIYNIIVGQTNEQIQEKAASDATFQTVNTDQYLIGYLMILKRICF